MASGRMPLGCSSDWRRIRAWPWHCLLLLLASNQATSYTLSASQTRVSRLACEDSRMCSLGKVQPFHGDIRSSPALKSCLAARSYRNEIILLTETRLNPAYQTFLSLLSLGYEHVVLLSLPERCARSAATWPRLACVWSSQGFVSNTKYLLDRVAFLVRAARLGAGVLLLDSDVLPLRDVYSLLWSPPLGNVTLAAMRDGNGGINCGVVYVRHARPDGPAAYMLAEIVDRLERWGENPRFVSDRGFSPGCWDQLMYSDTLLSVLAGRPLSYGCWFVGQEPRRSAWEEAHMRVFGANDGRKTLQAEHYLNPPTPSRWPPQLSAGFPDFPAPTVDLLTGLMRVPNTRGVWPEELGGQFYPRERGPSAQAWIDILKSDILPLWPDPEDPAQADAGAGITELFAYLPQYLGQSWSNGGALGYWNPSLRRRSAERPAGQVDPAAAVAATGGGVSAGGQQQLLQVVQQEEVVEVEVPSPVALAHFVHVPGGATNKLTVKMASANWDWDIAHASHPNRGVFFASSAAAPVPYVLAYSPSLERSEWASEAEFAAAVLSLMRVAMEMGRAAAYPAPRCNVSWLGGAGNNRLPLQVFHGAHIPYAPASAGFSDLRCLWGGYLQHGCQAVRSYFSGGLLAPEFDHLIDLLRPHMPPSDNNNPFVSGSNSSSGTASKVSGINPAESAAHLTELGFSAEAVAAATNISFIIPGTTTAATAATTVGSGGISTIVPNLVVTVPSEVLQPPPPATAWDVTELAARLSELYGGPKEPSSTTNSGSTTTGSFSSSAGSNGGSKPLVLVLPEVPKLSHKLGPKNVLFREQLETGPDRSTMSCEWIRTGRPYRRTRRRARMAV